MEKRALYDRLLDKRSLTEQTRLKAGATNGYTNVTKTQQDLAQRFEDLHQDFKVFIDAENEDLEMPMDEDAA